MQQLIILMLNSLGLGVNAIVSPAMLTKAFSDVFGNVFTTELTTFQLDSEGLWELKIAHNAKALATISYTLNDQHVVTKIEVK